MMNKRNMMRYSLAITFGSVLSLSVQAATQPQDQGLLGKTEQSVESSKHKIAEETKKVEAYLGDSEITAKVKEKLLRKESLPSRDISVTTIKGVVQLKGKVKSAAESERAQQIAEQVKGVKTVTNELQVNP